jgi:hypothetical protein
MLFALGCQNTTTKPSAGTGSVDHPETYAAAVTQIKQYRDQIRDAFAAGTPEQCDEALHHAAHVLEHVPDLAIADLKEVDVAAVKSASVELTELLAKIHEGFHGNQPEATFEELSDKINAAIAALEAKVTPPPN